MADSAPHMNEALHTRVERATRALEHDPDSILYGRIRPPTPVSAIPQDCPQEYGAFLQLSNGARCGSIDLFGVGALTSKQFMATDLPGGRGRWYVFGQVLYEPLVLSSKTRKVSLYSLDDPVRAERHFKVSLDTFLSTYVFGELYSSLVPDPTDQWLLMLRALG